MSIRLLFEPRDLWVGVFWDRRTDGLHVYVCPLPTVVLHIVRNPSPIITPGATPYDFCVCAVCGPPWRFAIPSWRSNPLAGGWMQLCPTCGDKRCPGAANHAHHEAKP